MSSECLGEAIGLSQSWRRPAAWITIVFCLLPLSVGLVYGVLAACSLLHYESQFWAYRNSLRIVSDLGLFVAFLSTLVCAGWGLAALWSALVPRVLNRSQSRRLRRWQLLGLRLGGVLALVLLTLIVVNGPGRNWAKFVLWLVPTAWSLLAARCLTGESGQRLFIPWQAVRPGT